MKYLFCVAVVTKRLLPELLDAYEKRSLTWDYPWSREAPGAAAVEEALYRSLGTSIDDVAFFRMLMDGWNPTHYWLGRYAWPAVAPTLSRRWKKFVNSGLFYAHWPLRDWAKAISALKGAQIRAIARRTRPATYATVAFLETLQDAILFSNATRGSIVMTARPVGAIMSDKEYYRPAEEVVDP